MVAMTTHLFIGRSERDNDRDDPVAAKKLNIRTDVKCDLGPSHCYSVFFRLAAAYPINRSVGSATSKIPILFGIYLIFEPSNSLIVTISGDENDTSTEYTWPIEIVREVEINELTTMYCRSSVTYCKDSARGARIMSTDAPTAMKTQKGSLYAARSKQSNCPSIPIETNDAGAKSIKATQANIEDFGIDATVLGFSVDLFIERNNGSDPSGCGERHCFQKAI